MKNWEHLAELSEMTVFTDLLDEALIGLSHDWKGLTSRITTLQMSGFLGSVFVMAA